MSESALLALAMYASVEFSRPDGGHDHLMKPFSLQIEVPTKTAESAVGVLGDEAKALLAGYITDRLIITQDGSRIDVTDSEGGVLCHFEAEPEHVYTSSPADSGDTPDGFDWYFGVDGCDLIRLQVAEV